MEREILIRFAEGKCSPEEARQVIEWLNEPGHRHQLDQMIQADLVDAVKNNVDAEGNDLSHLLKNILYEDHPEPVYKAESIPSRHRQLSGDRHNSRHLALKVAAVLVFLAALSVIFWRSNELPKVQVAQAYEEKENTEGRKSIIYLQDGSIVHLNSDSKITYPADFSDTLRAINLQGEAFFQVAKDESRPFIVYADNIAVTALGTSFNVKNYDNEAQIQVALESGRVSVEDYKNPANDSFNIFLDPGNMVQYNKKSLMFSSIEKADSKEAFGWKDGIIYFKKADMKTVFNRLERWYGVEFELGNQPGHEWSYTAEFHNQSLKETLESISFSQNFTYSLKDKHVHIMFN